MRLFLLIVLLQPLGALAEDYVVIIIKNHKFQPAEITIPAGKKMELIIDNQDPTPEEFESHELNREKIIAGNSKARIFIGPLAPGRYPFFGEFNEATAQGVIIVK
ncbi:MAG: cupredoxin domain-containing protein [Candidatus Nitrotoga sp.]